ncbi:MAG: hypothetical protein ACXVHD_26100, partial [Solirubrobacteraceae bacterium]
MTKLLRPGPGSLRGLMWLARVGPSPLEPWRFAMGWSEVAARNHARRLEREGWLERVARTRGEGSLFFATRKGVGMLGVALIGCTTPAPTSWAHDVACAWTAAWMTVRGRRFLGPRELLVDSQWSGRLELVHRISGRHLGHRPDFIGIVDDHRIALEVELAPKSRQRLDAILRLQRSWLAVRKTTGIVYVCGNEEGRRRIERANERVDVML